ncbi:peptidase M48 Ste24p [Natrinema sp. J7-2]|nr:peptidase M48 Ste24p [Natrinema sp. J7-2]
MLTIKNIFILHPRRSNNPNGYAMCDRSLSRVGYWTRLLVASGIVALLVVLVIAVAVIGVFLLAALVTTLGLTVLLADLHPVSIAVLSTGVGLVFCLLVIGSHAIRVASAPDLVFEPDVIGAELRATYTTVRDRIGAHGIVLGVGGVAVVALGGFWIGKTVHLEPDADSVLAFPAILSVLAVGTYVGSSIRTELSGTPAVLRLLEESIPGADETCESDQTDLQRRVGRLAGTAGVPTPNVRIAEIKRPMTLTVGYRPAASTIVVSRGLLETLDDRELEAVLAHELAHVASRDATVCSAISVPAAKLEAFFARYRRAAVAICCPIPLVVEGVFRWCVSVVARHRECVADDRATALMVDPASLASALETLERARERRFDDELSERHTVAAFSIVPRPWEERRVFDGPRRFVYRIVFETHPPTEKRIEQLRAATDER